MFLGEFEHTLDEKGRVAIPARFREGLGRGFVLTRGFDLCLQAFPFPIWEQLSARVSALPIVAAEARNMRRILFAHAAEVEIDRQGRVLIPHNLREYAGLTEQVVIAGMNTYFELWSAERWRALQASLAENGAAIAEQWASLGI